MSWFLLSLAMAPDLPVRPPPIEGECPSAIALIAGDTAPEDLIEPSEWTVSCGAPLECTLGKIETLVVHHTATPTSWTVEKIRKLHLDRGWRDVGYHYLIRLDEDKEARIYMGRPQDGDSYLSSLEIGAHVKGHNSKSLGISTIGNWSGKAMDTDIERVLIWLSSVSNTS